MRVFAFQSQLMELIVAAMREIGQDNITDEQITIIYTHLDQVGLDDYNHDIQLAPIWVRNTLLRKTGG